MQPPLDEELDIAPLIPLHPSEQWEEDEPLTRIIPHVMISGYYGFDNLGDEMILDVLTRELTETYGCEITVLSRQPAKTAKQYAVEAISRMNLIPMMDKLSQSHVFISGGGGLFQDATGWGSVIYYGGLIALARFMQVPVAIWNQGVGPLKRTLTRFLTSMAFKMAQHISVRDEASADLVMKLIHKRVSVAADPVWLYRLPAYPAVDDGDRWVIGVSLRPWAKLTDAQLAYLARFFCRLTSSSNKPVHFLLMAFQPKEDTPVLERFKSALRREGMPDTEMIAGEDIPAHIQRCHVLFGMRFHSLVLGMLAKVPVLGLAYDPKVWQLIHGLGLQGIDVGKFEELNVDRVRDYFYHYSAPDLEPYKRRARESIFALSPLMNVER